MTSGHRGNTKDSAEWAIIATPSTTRIRALLLEPFGPNGSGECALCAIDPVTQIDHASVLTAADDGAVLIVDGVFAFRPEINEYWDFRIWLEVSPEISVSRGTERDNDETIHRDRYLPAEQIYSPRSNRCLSWTSSSTTRPSPILCSCSDASTDRLTSVRNCSTTSALPPVRSTSSTPTPRCWVSTSTLTSAKMSHCGANVSKSEGSSR